MSTTPDGQYLIFSCATNSKTQPGAFLDYHTYSTSSSSPLSYLRGLTQPTQPPRKCHHATHAWEPILAGRTRGHASHPRCVLVTPLAGAQRWFPNLTTIAFVDERNVRRLQRCHIARLQRAIEVFKPLGVKIQDHLGQKIVVPHE